jgi:hypothetical protein
MTKSLAKSINHVIKYLIQQTRYFKGMIIMAVDGLSLYVITKELKEKLLNGRIQKSYQPKDNQLIINVYNRRII